MAMHYNRDSRNVSSKHSFEIIHVQLVSNFGILLPLTAQALTKIGKIFPSWIQFDFSVYLVVDALTKGMQYGKKKTVEPNKFRFLSTRITNPTFHLHNAQNPPMLQVRSFLTNSPELSLCTALNFYTNSLFPIA